MKAPQRCLMRAHGHWYEGTAFPPRGREKLWSVRWHNKTDKREKNRRLPATTDPLEFVSHYNIALLLSEVKS